MTRAHQPRITGQISEFLVWSTLLAHGGGGLHVFLPTRDMGIDGVLRHPGSDRMVCLQVKTRTVLRRGELVVQVEDAELADPRAHVLCAVLDIDGPRLREPWLLTPVPDFLRLAARVGAAHTLTAPFPPTPASRWRPFAVPSREVPLRLFGAGAAMPSQRVATPEQRRGADRAGFVAECELVRLLAEHPECKPSALSRRGVRGVRGAARGHRRPEWRAGEMRIAVERPGVGASQRVGAVAAGGAGGVRT